MGFMNAMGKAFKAPIKPIQKMVNKAPGMGAMNKAVGKVPGMNAMGGALGIGPSPQAAPPPMAPSPQQDMGQPMPSMDQPMPEIRDDMGMKPGAPQMPQGGDPNQMGQMAGSMRGNPQMGGMVGQLAQKFGQARSPMGGGMQPQQRGGSVGRAMGGAMRRMF